MARTAAGAALTVQHREAQLALRAAMLRDLLSLWPLFQVTDFGTFDAFATLATTLVIARNRDSAGLAAAYLGGFRIVEGEAGAVTTALATSPERAVVIEELRATGLLGVLNARRAGFSVEAAKRNGWVRVAGSAGSLVLDGGRQTILHTTERDPMATRWHRVTSGDPCAFCRMLAGRGDVFNEGSVGFQAHDHCSCVPEPAYPGSRPTPAALQYRAEWDQATRGLSGTEALNAYRQFLTASSG